MRGIFYFNNAYYVKRLVNAIKGGKNSPLKITFSLGSWKGTGLIG